MTQLTGIRVSGTDATHLCHSDGVFTHGSDGPVEHLDGAVVTPVFVDAHVHATSAGLLLTGLDLTACASLDDCLDTVRRFAATSDAPVLWGHGWDETRWPQRRPPTRAELDAAVSGRPAYLSRVDVHSAVASTPLAAAAAGRPGYHPDGPLSADAHHVVRRAAQDAVTPAQRAAAQRAFLGHAAAHGIGMVHECAGPDISAVDDLAALLAPAAGAPIVVGYWGALVGSAAEATSVLARTGAHGLAGDLFCDGAIGSRTAALREPYADAPGTGNRYLSAAQIAAHVAACTEVGVQAGFHVIGDAAMDAVLEGFELAARQVGVRAVAARAHRLEHAEMVIATQAGRLATWGVVASVQPLFDAYWGGPDGMYTQRLGPTRGITLNPFATIADAGVTLAFGSDAPVTAVDPWAAVRAAVHHRTPGSGLTPEAAFRAHTTGGVRAAGPRTPRGPGAFAGAWPPRVGEPATFAVWDGDGLADLDHPPRCLRTVVRGKTIFASPTVVDPQR
jgi:predicted amidohydrolase YtcJ